LDLRAGKIFWPINPAAPIRRRGEGLTKQDRPAGDAKFKCEVGRVCEKKPSMSSAMVTDENFPEIEGPMPDRSADKSMQKI
jgi:hypothetical protein